MSLKARGTVRHSQALAKLAFRVIVLPTPKGFDQFPSLLLHSLAPRDLVLDKVLTLVEED